MFCCIKHDSFLFASGAIPHWHQWGFSGKEEGDEEILDLMFVSKNRHFTNSSSICDVRGVARNIVGAKAETVIEESHNIHL